MLDQRDGLGIDDMPIVNHVQRRIEADLDAFDILTFLGQPAAGALAAGLVVKADKAIDLLAQ